MPWIAEHKGDPITPQKVTEHDHFTCPKCDSEMYVRGPFVRSDGEFVARHFAHNPDSTSSESPPQSKCGGETDEHKRMKSIAYSKFKHLFGEEIVEIEFEMPIANTEKYADVGVVFSEDIDTNQKISGSNTISGAVGNRVAIEVQYQNESKDIQGTTRTYAENGFTTLWLYPEQFSKFDVDIFTGSGAVWRPVYPEVTRSDIEFPDGWQHHVTHLNKDVDTTGVVNATFPVNWFTTELKAHLAANGKGPKYERWSRLFPEVAQSFVDLAEEVFEDPVGKVSTPFEYIFPTSELRQYTREGSTPISEIVCGNCWYSKPDEYRDNSNALVCWQNKPNDDSNRPRKISLNDEFAQECDHFSFSRYKDDEMAEMMDLDESLQRVTTLQEVAGVKGVSDREQRKAILKYAYYQTWRKEEWNESVFSPAREEAILRELDSKYAVPHEYGCAGSGETIFPKGDNS